MSGEARKGPGRPPLSPSERKAAIFSVRLSPEELVQVEAAAKAQGIKPSKWARQVLLDAVTRAQSG